MSLGHDSSCLGDRKQCNHESICVLRSWVRGCLVTTNPKMSNGWVIAINLQPTKASFKSFVGWSASLKQWLPFGYSFLTIFFCMFFIYRHSLSHDYVFLACFNPILSFLSRKFPDRVCPYLHLIAIMAFYPIFHHIEEKWIDSSNLKILS